MATINLIPWRELKKKKAQRRLFFMIFFSLLLISFMMYGIKKHYEYVLHKQFERNRLIQHELNQIKQQLLIVSKLKKKKDVLISRLRALQRWTVAGAAFLSLLEELLAITPKTITYQKISSREQHITLEGRAGKEEEIAALMYAVEHNPRFNQPLLDEIKDINTHSKQFKLRVQQKWKIDDSL